jgi:sterol 24-C-methyltransferase
MSKAGFVLAVLVAWWFYPLASSVSLYQLQTSYSSLKGLLRLSKEDVDKCVAAHQFLMRHGGGGTGDTKKETEHVRNLYAVLHQLLAVLDIEKLYIPPMLDENLGLFGNQLLLEQQLAREINVSKGGRVLDIGCGRGRVAHHISTITEAHVSGFNIDHLQVENAKEYAAATGMASQLDFKVGDHHERFLYDDESFDGAYSIQAVWPFFKVHELDGVAKELYRVLKPGSTFTCSEYLLTPFFKWDNPKHAELHRIWMPTLMASQSNYPSDVVNALERAGFTNITSEPSEAPTWPICDSKTQLFHTMRAVVVWVHKIGLCPDWLITLIDNLLKGGRAWTLADRAKLADLNWHIKAKKPLIR